MIILLDTKRFEYIKTRETGSIGVFKSEDGTQFLRIGDKVSITLEVGLHRKLIQNGFPVPPIISEGEYGKKAYYIEQSLGEKHLSDLFLADYTTTGEISNTHFNSLLSLSKLLAKAQLRTVQDKCDLENLYSGILMHTIQKELPHLWDRIRSAYWIAVQKIAQLPFVASHGDLNPHNMFERGIIDFGDAHDAPLGYDLVCNVYQEFNFPKIGDYESMRWFELSPKQIGEYFFEIDGLLERSGASKISDFKEDFIVLRAIRSTARIGKNTKLRQWRTDRLAKILASYISGASIMDVVLHFR